MRIILLLTLLSLASCTSDDIQQKPQETGIIQLTVRYDQPPPAGAIISAAIFECPFTMPPLATPAFTPTAFPATGDLEGVPVGDHCLYVYLDVDPNDGPDPKFDLDPINALPEGAMSIPFSLAEGQTLPLEVELYLKGGGGRGREEDSGVASDMGVVDPAAPSVEVTIDCAACDSDADLIFYGAPGAVIGMPSYYHAFSQPTFPFTATLSGSANVMGAAVDWAEGEATFEAYQDTTPGGMRAEAGEPRSAPVTLSLKPGLNAVRLTLE
ncbi:hypothetical protein KKF91_21690 [Myxococcota bacterium]|nr:hypothetical protein [Myxococcota bacterium]MBU1433158.1 hypothetical protein [Myxococcota bacterium]MBU1899325.1 hypothetical protein [Myxococcota bacterium]